MRFQISFLIHYIYKVNKNERSVCFCICERSFCFCETKKEKIKTKFQKIKAKKKILERAFALFRGTIYILYFCFPIILTRFRRYGKK